MRLLVLTVQTGLHFLQLVVVVRLNMAGQISARQPDRLSLRDDPASTTFLQAIEVDGNILYDKPVIGGWINHLHRNPKRQHLYQSG